MYLPLHNVSKRQYYFRVPVKTMCLFTVSLPLFAFIICVIMTMYKDFDKANHTHCGVPNIFPSISASIGNYEPQYSLWQTAVYVHAPLRFYILYMRWKYYRSVMRDDCIIVVKLAVFLNIIENISLLGLTYWTSSRNYPYHELCFKTFIGASIIYMLLTCVLLSRYRRRPNITSVEKYSVKLKWRSLFINVSSFTFAAFFFIRHNRLCEPYVYSMFGFSEYIVVVSNMAFHMTTVFDLPAKHVTFSRRGITTE